MTESVILVTREQSTDHVLSLLSARSPSTTLLSRMLRWCIYIGLNEEEDFICQLRSVAWELIPFDTGVGAQSTLGEHQIFARKICTKNSKMPEFYMILARKKYRNTRIFMIFARKIYKISEFYVIFARKVPEFYVIIARKIFFPKFRGARAPPSSPTPMPFEALWAGEG